MDVQVLQLTANPTMLCRGMIAVHPPGALFVLESLRGPFDHLQCRQPSNVNIYVIDNIGRMVKSLKNSSHNNPISLESYKYLIYLLLI